MKKGYQIQPAKLGTTALLCEYLNVGGKMSSCKLDPMECFLGNRGTISDDGSGFTPIEQPSMQSTLRNCPKINH